MDTSSESLMTVADVATWLRVERQTVERWARRGRVPAIRLEGRYRFRREEVEAWLRTREISR
jgi:excisionase family DNA binding protein